MPWASGRQYAAEHDKKLKGSAVTKAAEVATAMIKDGVGEGEAIATASKLGGKLMRKRRSIYRKKS